MSTYTVEQLTLRGGPLKVDISPKSTEKVLVHSSAPGMTHGPELSKDEWIMWWDVRYRIACPTSAREVSM